MKRVFLFLVTNLAVMLVLGIAASLLGVNRYLTANGLDLSMLLGFAAVMGFGGALISLLISKPMAKWSAKVQVINDSPDATHQWLVNTVQRFAQQANIGMPEVGIFEGAPNAFATGAFKNSALVAVSTGLLQGMSREEVEAVIGHEVAHVANGDMVTMTLIQGVMNTFVVFLSRVIGYFVDRVILKNERGLGIGYYVSTIVLDMVLGVLAAMVVAWFSRQREFRADAGAAQLMGRRQPMINALARLGGLEPGELPRTVEAMGIGGKRGVMALLSTHPPIEDRIRALQAGQIMSRRHRIAVLPGDGIGKEVMPEGLRVLRAAAKRFDIGLDFTPIEWASCDWYLAHGQMMPDDWKDQLSGVDALYYGAVGWPATVPDHVSLWGSLLKFRREFDQYVNLRPVRLFDGVPCPLAGRKPGDIDFFVVRENTEGEYTNLGGVLYGGTEREIVIQESVFSRHGTDRVMKFAFELAASRPRKKLTVATKSNGIAISMPWWDSRADEIGKAYPGVAVDKQHIDILSARFVLQPDRFDVVVASNLFGDILSDLGPACTGTIGLAPSANLNPERSFPSLFEPVHGSAPDIYGQNIANPVAMIWSGALMLDFLGHRAAHDAIVAAIEQVLIDGPRTRDVGGTASTTEMGEAIAARLLA